MYGKVANAGVLEKRDLFRVLYPVDEEDNTMKKYSGAVSIMVTVAIGVVRSRKEGNEKYERKYRISEELRRSIEEIESLWYGSMKAAYAERKGHSWCELCRRE